MAYQGGGGGFGGGAREMHKAVCAECKKECEVPIITKTADYKGLLNEDIFATDIYNMAVFHKYGTKLASEYKQAPIRNQ